MIYLCFMWIIVFLAFILKKKLCLYWQCFFACTELGILFLKLRGPFKKDTILKFFALICIVSNGKSTMFYHNLSHRYFTWGYINCSIFGKYHRNVIPLFFSPYCNCVSRRGNSLQSMWVLLSPWISLLQPSMKFSVLHYGPVVILAAWRIT